MITKIIQNETSSITWEQAETQDVEVDKKGNCLGYPCPMTIKIFSENFGDAEFNGYYVINFPLPYGNSKMMIKLRVDPSNQAITIFSDFMGATYDTSSKDIVWRQRFAPTYKHLNYNIYLFPWFEKIPNEYGKVMWAITRTPKKAECLGNFKNKPIFIKL